MKIFEKQNHIYAAINRVCSELEGNGSYNGNSHHLSQRLTTVVSESLLSKQQKLIYDVLDEGFKSVKEISLITGLSSKIVSSVLGKLYKDSVLVNCKSIGRLKHYRKS